MIADFVEKRGGGLLMLGGPRAFAEGSYTGTPVADVLPVVLERPTKTLDAGAVARLKVRPTRDGVAHAVTQLGANEQASAAIWDKLPALTSINPLRTLKPGAVTLLSGADERRREQVVLAYQRYGRGKAIAFPVQDSWLWQMHADIPVEDMTHENYWRQLMRWLVDGVPDHVEAHTSADRVEAGETVTITADVVDPTSSRSTTRARWPTSRARRASSTCRCSGPASAAASIAARSSRRARGSIRRASRRHAATRRSAPASRSSAPLPATPNIRRRP